MNLIPSTRGRQRGLFALAMTLTASLLTSGAHASGYKHVSVAPEDAQQQQLPNGKDTGVFSHSALLPVNAPTRALGNGTQVITQTLTIDNTEASPIAFIGPDAEHWQLTLIDPDGRVAADEAQTALTVQDIALGNESFRGKQLQLENHKVGQWQVRLTRAQNAAAMSNQSLSRSADAREPLGYLLVKGDPNYKVYSYRDTPMTVQNKQVNLVAYLVDARADRGERHTLVRKSPLAGSISQASVTLTAPDNSTTTLQLNDAGINGDAVAGDGRYSATLPTDQVGVYTQTLMVQGTRPDGLAFSRTTTDLYPVVARTYRFDRQAAQLSVQANGDIQVSVPVKTRGDAETVFMSAEIWGTNARGEQELAHWVGGLVDPTNTDRGTQLALISDSRWLTQKNLQAPFELRKLRLQHKDNHTPIARAKRKPLDLSSADNQALSSGNLRSPQTLLATADRQGDMRVKVVGTAVPLAPARIATAAAGSTLMLVHGYCSSSAWSTGDFANAVEFKDYKANRSHDAFALKIRDFGANYSSFGVVAHSQGGAAALHLYARYVSGLDYASGGRLIQSVGTPYQGTALAGNLAVLGQIFGAGCGKNTDLTYSGAANWLATIPSWARSAVDYYTTSFKDRWWAYDYCHIATDLLLDDPEDGTTEKWSGQLSGAVNKGHKTGWCHTSGMRDPAQTRDTSRNSSMSSRAAR